MNKLKMFAGVLALFVTLPIGFYLQYKVLSMVGASELMWFLFWIHVPVLVLVSLISKLVDD